MPLRCALSVHSSDGLGTLRSAPDDKPSMPPARDAVVTIDVPEHDDPTDIRVAGERLSTRGIRATFSVPTALYVHRALRATLRAVRDQGHEMASHSHSHDWAEIGALMHGAAADLGFLALSKRIHEDVFCISPV